MTNTPLRIAIASGKGGTGKTTLATNLVVTLAEAGERVAYLDCDVEEPNGHLFLKPNLDTTGEVTVPVPEVDASRCTRCGACARACRYSAIVALKNQVLTFPKLCHGCGGCSLACPEGAIQEVPRTIGLVERGTAGKATFLRGKLEIGEAMAPPVIRAVLAAAPADTVLILDAPPGTSCPAIESVKTADVVVLVTEPTPFGLNDLKLAVEMVEELGIPFGVVVNRAGSGNNDVFRFCSDRAIPVLLEVPNDPAIARAYSRGDLFIDAVPSGRGLLADLYAKLGNLTRSGRPRRRMSHPLPALQSQADDRSVLPSESLLLGRREATLELVVVSGKGGTGKTSLVASFFALADQAVAADCDVDAADLYLVVEPTILHSFAFSGGHVAVIDAEVCNGCGECAGRCRFEAILTRVLDSRTVYEVDPVSCEGCGVCVDTCPAQAVAWVASASGQWFLSDTRHGPMTHARLGVAQSNSGKLVSLLRREGLGLAATSHRRLLICDGSPGIGCPVIASLSGASLVLIVTEPTLSGLHDFRRIAQLTRLLGVRAGVCVNKADLNAEVADEIEREAADLGILVFGRVRYDESVTGAQIRRTAVVRDGIGPAATDIRVLWEQVRARLLEQQAGTSRVLPA